MQVFWTWWANSSAGLGFSVRWFLDGIVPGCKVLFVLLGGNDLDSTMYQEAVFLDKLKALLRRWSMYTSKIAFVEILPRKGEGVHPLYEERRLRANSNIKRWCMEEQVATSFVAVNRRVKCFRDGVHLTLRKRMLNIICNYK